MIFWMWTAETDARRLRRKNAKALRLAIEQSKREEKEAAAEKARVVRVEREQEQGSPLDEGVHRSLRLQLRRRRQLHLLV